ncbi:DUF3088 domain-containing protein [Liberibacter crescens]|nr:DUF3088 domain-containing protein [Liberibacter crescens]AMC13428.1 hypothetical protein RL73_06800 [Liberibacter crescens]
MKRDKLFLIQPGFEDPKYPGQIFYCWHCALLEGVLASFPEAALKIDVERIPWTYPRLSIIELVGEENQSLPILVLADGSSSTWTTNVHLGHSFIADKEKILNAISERHGFPSAHP